MAENGYGGVTGHVGRIPNFGKTQVNPMGHTEPPACIQNAMMTKDKKPFTYTPGGLDLSQIKTPSMARRMARQRSQEDHEQAYTQQANQGGYHPQGGPAGPGGPAPPPPPPPKVPAPPPPPPLVIEAPKAKSPKPPAPGERPEIVIPENPIGMLRKTNSPYHWEAEKAEMQKMGPVPKFQEKVPSPLTVQMPPSTFSQQPPQYTPPGQNIQRPNYGYGNQNQPESPIHRPEAQYANNKPVSPNVNGSPVTRELLQRQDSQFNKSPQPFAGQSPLNNGSPYSPSPNNNWRQPERRENVTSPQSPQINRNQFSPNVQQFSPNQQNQQFSPNQHTQQHLPNQQYAPHQQQQQYLANQQNQQYSPHQQHQQYSPNQQNQQYSPNPQKNQYVQNYPNQNTAGPVYHTLPRAAPKAQENNIHNNNTIYNNGRGPQGPNVGSNDPHPWRSNTVNKQKEPENLQNIYHNSQPINQQPKYTPPWANNEHKNNQTENAYIPPWKQQEHRNVGAQQQQQYIPSWNAQDANNNKIQENYNPQWRQQQEQKVTQPSPPAPTRQYPPQEQPRYQTSMSIPVTPRKPNTQPEPNNREPQREIVYVNEEPVYYCPGSPKSIIPPFVKTQKEKTKTPPPVWVQRPLEGRKSAPRELVTPPRDTNQEPEWVRKSNEMQRGVREVISPPKYPQPAQPSWSTRPSDNRKSLPKDNAPGAPGARVIPVQVEDTRGQFNQAPYSQNQGGQAPYGQNTQAPYSQPTQRIMRVLSPTMVRLDDGAVAQDLPSLNKSFPSSQGAQSAKERIIPIQIEGGGNSGANKRVYYHKFSREAPPRQSKAFRVLQVITGTQDIDRLQGIEQRHGYTDL